MSTYWNYQVSLFGRKWVLEDKLIKLLKGASLDDIGRGVGGG